jgi:hypothetical protein
VATELEAEALDRPPQAVEERLVPRPVHWSRAGLLGLLVRRPGDLGGLRPPIGGGVEVEVGQQAAEPGAARQQAGGQVER